jgi:hypothetical protein
MRILYIEGDGNVFWHGLLIGRLQHMGGGYWEAKRTLPLTEDGKFTAIQSRDFESFGAALDWLIKSEGPPVGQEAVEWLYGEFKEQSNG